MSTGAKFDVDVSPEIVISKAQLLSLAMDPDYPEQFVRWLNNKLKSDMSGIKMELVFNNEYRLETVKALQKIQIPRLLTLIGSTPNVTSKDPKTVKKLFLQSKFRSLVTVPEGSKELTTLERSVERIQEIQRELQFGVIETTRYMELFDIVEKLLQQFRQLEDMDTEHIARIKQVQKTPDAVITNLQRNPAGIEARKFLQDGLTAIRNWLLSHNNDILEFDAFHGVYRQRYLASWRSVVEQLSVSQSNGNENASKSTGETVSELQREVANLNVDAGALVDKLKLFNTLNVISKLIIKLHAQTPHLMTNYFIDAHRFAVIKIADFAGQLAANLLSQDLKDIKVALSQTLDLLALLCEHAYRRKRLFTIAANAINKDAANSAQKTGKNFHLLTPEDRNKHVTDLIKQIKRRESLLAIQRDSLIETPTVEMAAERNATPSMDAVKALFGLTAEDLETPLDTSDNEYEYGGQALETIVSDVMLRYVSRFFVVSARDRLFYIDFILEDDEFSGLVSSLNMLKDEDVAESRLLTSSFRQQEDNRLRFLRGLENHYRRLAKRRQAETIKLDITKFLYQKYLLPFEQANVGAAKPKPFRQGPIKLSDDAACIICLLPDHEKSYADCTPFLTRIARSTDTAISTVTRTDSSIVQDVANTLNNPKQNLFQQIQDAVNMVVLNNDYAALMESFPDIDVQPRLLIMQCMQSAVQLFRQVQQTLMLIFDENTNRKVQAATIVDMARFRETVRPSLPGWYNDDLANQYITDVLFDDKFVQRKTPAEMLLSVLNEMQNFLPFFTVNKGVNSQTGGGMNRDARYATDVVLRFLQVRDAYLDHDRSYIEQLVHYFKSSKMDTPADRLVLDAVTRVVNHKDIITALFSNKRPIVMLPATEILAQIGLAVTKETLVETANNGQVDWKTFMSILPLKFAEAFHVRDTETPILAALQDENRIQQSWLLRKASQDMHVTIPELKKKSSQ